MPAGCGHGHEVVFAATGTGHRHRPRAGHPAPGLVPLRPLRARPRPPRRGARRGGDVHVAGCYANTCPGTEAALA
jgi:hypothetical protein